MQHASAPGAWKLLLAFMSIWQGILSKLGLSGVSPKRDAIRVFLLDDDESRHDWFDARFAGDHLDIAIEPRRAIELLSQNFYDAVFLDHDLLPQHYKSSARDDERTGYAVAAWLAANPRMQSAATILVHTRNADGAMRMVEELRRAGRRAEYVPFQLLPQKIKHYWQR
jgi:CheY-like chemotaxis protein